ncbi:MAG: threonine synthase [Candidatus Lokiarchaeota archaeon]|nr:threonine synthase [Candidatus Lokiarchaeota archaeon]MBD3339958.1 threonine synthase [Candidatus Lokiarchaeota archaeon]
MKKSKTLQSNSTLINVKCTACGKTYDPASKPRLCSCGKVLYPEYDLEKAKETINKNDMSGRSYDIWRMCEIMPVNKPEFRFSLGEGWTPLLRIHNFGGKIGLKNLFIKDEGQNPTGTFKSRGLCAAVSKACELGVKEFVIPSAGNAGAALAAYASRAQTTAHIFMPQDAPKLIQGEVKAMGGELVLVDGLITDAGKIAKKNAEQHGWFDVSTLKEPYRVEGKKTMGLELAEQFNWSLPDVIIYPTGGGTGIVGMWKAFKEMEILGIIGRERPKMVSVQTSGCAPIVKAFKEGKTHADFWENADTVAGGLRVPAAIGDYLILNAIRESKGTAISVDDNEVLDNMFELAKTEGIMLCPEAAATVAGVKELVSQGLVDQSERVVLFGTGSGFTTPEFW